MSTGHGKSMRISGRTPAEEAGTVVVTADNKLLETQGDSHYDHLGHPLVDAVNPVSGAR